MIKPFEDGNAVHRIKQLVVGRAQKYWNLPTSGSFLFSEQKRDNTGDAFHSSCSTLTERLRKNQESFSNFMTGNENRGRSASIVDEENFSGHFNDFLEELANVLHKRKAAGKSTRSFNKEKEQVMATSPINLDSHLPACVSSREQMAQRKARIVRTKQNEEFSTLENPTTGSLLSVPDMVESSESSMSRSSFTGNYSRSASRRQSIARARRLSNCGVAVVGDEDDHATPDIPQTTIGRRPSRTRPTKQSSRSEMAQPHTSRGDKHDTEQSISPTTPCKPTFHNKLRRRSIVVNISEMSDESNKLRRRSIHVESSQSSSERSPQPRRVRIDSNRHSTHPDFDTTVNSEGTRFISSLTQRRLDLIPKQPQKDTSCTSINMKRSPLSLLASPKQTLQTLKTAPQKNTACEIARHSPRQQKRGGLQRTSPRRQRASADIISSHNSLQQSEHILPSRHHTRVESSNRLSESDHLPFSSTMSYHDSGKTFKNMRNEESTSRRNSMHAPSFPSKSNKRAMQESAAWQDSVPFLGHSDSNNPTSSSSPLFEEESFPDAFFAKPDQATATFPRRLDLSKSDTVLHSQKRSSSKNDACTSSPVARRMMRRAQALSSTSFAIYV